MIIAIYSKLKNYQIYSICDNFRNLILPKCSTFNDLDKVPISNNLNMKTGIFYTDNMNEMNIMQDKGATTINYYDKDEYCKNCKGELNLTAFKCDCHVFIQKDLAKNLLLEKLFNFDFHISKEVNWVKLNNKLTFVVKNNPEKFKFHI